MKRTNTAKWLENQNRWQIKVQKDGVRRTFTSSKPGRTGQRETNAKADAWLDDNISRDSVRCSVLFDEYISILKEATSTSNWKQYESFGNSRILPQIGQKKISAVHEGDLQRILDKAVADGLARKTVSGLRTCLYAFIRYCRQNKATPLFPEGLIIRKSAKKPAEKSILQPWELKILFSSDETFYGGKIRMDEYVAAYRLQVLTGLRPGELLGLEATDLIGKQLHLHRSYNRYQETTTGKNDNARRIFQLSEQAYKLLAKEIEIMKEGRIWPISQQSYRDRFQAYCKHNGLDKHNPYELRHTFVSISKQLPEGWLKSLVGHSANMDTYGVYGHEVEGEREQIAAALENVFQDILG